MENIYQKKMTKIKELLLDTRGVCFLCLKDVAEKASNQVMREFCLGSICNYLNIDPCSILFKVLKGTLVNDEEAASPEDGLCDFSVMLCVNCSVTTAKLSELIRQVEITKMLINRNLQTFHQLLVASEQTTESQSSWRKLKEKIISCSDNPVEAILVEQLRLETKEKCTAKVERLLSPRTPNIPVTRVPPPTSSSDTSPLNKEIPHVSENKAQVAMNKNLDEPSASPGATMIATKCINVKQFISQLFPRSNRQRLSRFKCPFCSCIQSYSNIRRHVVRCHLEKCFAHRRLPNISELSFKEICQILITNAVHILPSSSNNHTSNLQCLFCSRQYQSKTDVKFHLVMEHANTLEERLLRLQGESLVPSAERNDFAITCANPQDSEPTVEAALSKNPNFSSSKVSGPTTHLVSTILENFCSNPPMGKNRISKNGYCCLICMNLKNCYPKSTVLKHMVNVHPEKFFGHVKTPQLPEKAFINCCKHILRAMSTEAKSVSKAANRLDLQCRFCQLNCRHCFNLKYHMVFQHYRILEGELRNLQDSQMLAFSDPSHDGNEELIGTMQIPEDITCSAEIFPVTTPTHADQIVFGNNIMFGACNTPEGARAVSPNHLLNGHINEYSPDHFHLNRPRLDEFPQEHIDQVRRTGNVPVVRNVSDSQHGFLSTYPTQVKISQNTKKLKRPWTRQKNDTCLKRASWNVWVCSPVHGGCGKSFSNAASLRKHQQRCRKCYKEIIANCQRNFATASCQDQLDCQVSPAPRNSLRTDESMRQHETGTINPFTTASSGYQEWETYDSGLITRLTEDFHGLDAIMMMTNSNSVGEETNPVLNIMDMTLERTKNILSTL